MHIVHQKQARIFVYAGIMENINTVIGLKEPLYSIIMYMLRQGDIRRLAQKKKLMLNQLTDILI